MLPFTCTILGSDVSNSSSRSTVHQSNDSFSPYSVDSRNVSRTVKILPQNQTVRGIAVLDDEIFVALDNQSHVAVYDSHTLTATRNISIPGWRSTRCIVVCGCSKALFIVDWKLESIHKVDLASNNVTLWKTGEIYMPEGLSLTTENRLLATVWLNGHDGESRLVEYTSEGHPIREIVLDISIRYAFQTLQLPNKQFIIAHGDSRSSIQRICVINEEGQIINCFGGEEGRGEGRVSGPYSIVQDSSRKRVFVADCWNNRIIILDTNVTYIGQLQTPVGLRYPYRLHFDASTDQLLVGEFNTASHRARLFIMNLSD